MGLGGGGGAAGICVGFQAPRPCLHPAAFASAPPCPPRARCGGMRGWRGRMGWWGGGSGGRVDGGGRGQRGHGAGGHVDGRNLQSWARSPPKMLGSPVGVCPLGDCHRLGGGGGTTTLQPWWARGWVCSRNRQTKGRGRAGDGDPQPHGCVIPLLGSDGAGNRLCLPLRGFWGGGGGSPAASGLVGPRLLLHLTCQGGI